MTLRTTILVFYIVSYLNAEINAHNSSRCDFFDSVDLTNARKLENGSYVFQDILIPAELTFTHVEDQTSIRGCVCEIKPCINFCSPAVGPQESLSWVVKMKDGTVVNKRLEDVFALQRGSTIPCDEYNSLNIVRWELLEKLFDRCCVCYLACLTVGFIFLSVDKWEIASQESKVRRANGWSAVIYYYGPMTLIIVCNIAMFVLTAVELLRQEKFIRNSLGTQLQRALKTKRKTYVIWKNHQTYFIFLLIVFNFSLCTFSKLFVLMGVTWHLEILSYLCKTNSITIIGDLINSAQGLYIFVVLVLNKTVLKHLRKR
ncbi:G-protein coupled receptor Mth-like [Scaptodrosophila lebanonensis]|uniref:G-protein coupled receptor Mth-like n=1 Tax=Drosophila lebanonensis TaxID=7225 RepID=A0A6J2TW75_DROLE|nr:G-protein coupled receptor Mth-like [Scaptodrosophila lebanonensis]